MSAKGSVAHLSSDKLTKIFLFLNQQDLPAVSCVNKNWHSAFQDNRLWYAYAKKAFLIWNDSYQEKTGYKELLKEHSNFSLIKKSVYNTLSSINNYNLVAGTCQKFTINDSITENFIRAFREEIGVKESLKFLGMLNGGKTSGVRAVSADGQVMAGWSSEGDSEEAERACIWKKTHGMQLLETLNGGKRSQALAVSADGQVVAGWSSEGNSKEAKRACIWKRDGVQSLGTLNGGTMSKAQAVSADGKIVLGSSRDGAANNKDCAFIWTKSAGMKSIKVLLEEKGVSSLNANDSLTSVIAVSPSGTLVIGQGLHNQDHTFYWKASIPRGNLF